MQDFADNALDDVTHWITENPLGGDPMTLVEDYCGTDTENAAYAAVVLPAAGAHVARVAAIMAAGIRAGTCDALLHRASNLSDGVFTYDHARLVRNALNDEEQAAEWAEMSADEKDPFSLRNHGRLL